MPIVVIMEIRNEIKSTDKDFEKKKFVVRNAADIQRAKLDKLMKNPEKPIVLPEPPKGRDFSAAIPSFVRNVMGSSAGAGSGEFHVYRHLRRKEYARQKYIQEKSRSELMDEEFQEKLEQNKQAAEARTAKKRAKRLKKKANQKANRGKKPKKEESDDRSSSEEEDDDEEGTEKDKEDAFGHDSESKVAEEKLNDESIITKDIAEPDTGSDSVRSINNQTNISRQKDDTGLGNSVIDTINEGEEKQEEAATKGPPHVYVDNDKVTSKKDYE
ncbi:PRKR-interacting protein 1 homolog [Toxorhynchites rutilus septentrionalis]|uniref:PRKR-interacting protein 1 homolog n=1 Tax=Toxorhynchites rutilus septentrionalis TaxID=329112 RepID=UPI00247B074F|nr:PRKR-interacting protein 1 homolog [Toxorhynchites rutilus septentrionalis]